MSTKAEKVKAQSLAAVGVHFNDYRRHLVGPNELEAALEAMEILKALSPMLPDMAVAYANAKRNSGEQLESANLCRLVNRATEVV